MHIFLDKFHQFGKYSAQVASHQAELRREEIFTDQKPLSLSYLQTDCINIDSSSGCGKNIERENLVQKKFTFCGGANYYEEKCFKTIKRKGKKLVQMVIWTTNVRNAHLKNVLDADLKII